MGSEYKRSKVGFPIRKSSDQSSFAAPQGLSQRTTSFIASQRQGIHRMPLRHLIALIINAHRTRRAWPLAKPYDYGRRCPSGGARRDRTDDLLLAKQALSQLSYGPDSEAGNQKSEDQNAPSALFWFSDFGHLISDNGGPGTTRTSDLTLIRGAL